jgi:putative oxidoreductase
MRAWSLTALRLVMGFGFMAHGWAKWSRGLANFAKLLHQVGVPHPTLAAWSVTMLELFSGLALFLHQHHWPHARRPRVRAARL